MAPKPLSGRTPKHSPFPQGVDIDAAHKTADASTWPDGTRKSQYNEFNWNTGEPSFAYKQLAEINERKKRNYAK